MSKDQDKFCIVQHVGPPSEGRVNIAGTLTSVDASDWEAWRAEWNRRTPLASTTQEAPTGGEG